MIEITCNDRLGKKVSLDQKAIGNVLNSTPKTQVRVKCNPDDTIGDLKKLIAAQTGTKHEKIVLKKWYTIYKDPIRLSDCKPLSNCFAMNTLKRICFPIFLDEIHDGMNLELYYQ